MGGGALLDEPVRAPVLIRVEPFAVVTADALADENLWPVDGAPLAGLLAKLAGLTLAPPFDAKHRQVGQKPEAGPDRAEIPAMRLRTNTVASSRTASSVHMTALPFSVNIQNGSM